MSSHLYIFLDESGDFNFTRSGSRFFITTSLTTHRPFEAFKALHNLRYDLIQDGAEVEEYFHACEDKQAVRDRVFDVIRAHLDSYRIDSVIVEKRKTGPALRTPAEFYATMLGYLIRYIVRGTDLTRVDEVLVFAASLFSGQRRRPAEKTIKLTMAKMLPEEVRYRLIYQSAKSNLDLQLADYCTWAIYKKWSSEEKRPYNVVKPAIHSEFDIFRKGTRLYY